MAAVSVVEDADGVARAAHQQPATGRQQRHAARRRAAGVASRCCCIRRRGARCSWASGTGVTAASAAEDPTLRGRRGRAAAGGDRRVGSLHARARRRRPAPRLHVRGGRCAPLRARQRSALRRDRLGQLPSGAQRVGRRCTPWSTSRPCAAARRGRRVLPVAAAAPARSRHAAQHRAVLPGGRIRRAGPCSRATAWRRRCSGWSRVATQSRFDVAAIRERLARAALPDARRGLGLEDELAVLGSFVAGPEALRRFAANAAANTDDHPVVAYRAPRITYAPDSQPARPADRAAARAAGDRSRSS